MKKVIVICAALALSASAFAQKANLKKIDGITYGVQNLSTLPAEKWDEIKQLVFEAKDNPETAENYKTWEWLVKTYENERVKMLMEYQANGNKFKDMKAFFENGQIRRAVSSGNVQAVYYPIDDKDSSIIVMDYTETDTMKMYFTPERKLEKIWMPKATGTWYPLTQIPSNRLKLEQFAWFDELRPVDKDDIFVWRGKESDNKLKVIERHSAPLQHLSPEEPVAVLPVEEVSPGQRSDEVAAPADASPADAAGESPEEASDVNSPELQQS